MDMRDRDVIQASGMKAEYLILEVLLDIRHVLMQTKEAKEVKPIGRPKKIK